MKGSTTDDDDEAKDLCAETTFTLQRSSEEFGSDSGFGNNSCDIATIENESRKRSKPSNLMRRLSSIPTAIRVHIRIQNFFLKYILFCFNFMSWSAGLIAVGIGLWNMVDDGGAVTESLNFIMDPSLTIIILGVITFTVACPGCLGAVRENIILLRVFYISLSIVLVVEIIAGTIVIVFYSDPNAREKLRHAPETVLKRAIIHYRDDDYYKKWMDNIQKQFKCCGISHTDEGYKDWQLNIYYNCSAQNPSSLRCGVPVSCCIFHHGERMNLMCGYDKTDKDPKHIEVDGWIYTQGCMKGFGEWLRKHEQIIITVAVVVMIMQLAGVIFAIIFVKRVQQQKLRWRHLQARQEPVQDDVFEDDS